ncbi:NADPH-dependent FMN reductase [Pedobacter montanisoli]|uniref:NAD(P)H-dependent oxidoreductase n=1 Tax=Pedobacter montanisoli TaxID=2923277 RepID=A0ABS9ZUR6_9SPHI|nr:NAD(P)H-dependent oxidoreductase [Pedobacter montanisoli]MCJ0742325.1 NAD(P)H-dependent oxidoreductase [Pedobacter montanisoli]
MNTIIVGTNRPNSFSLKVANFYQKELAKKGLETNLFNLQDLPDNFIANDLYGKKSAEFEKIQLMVTQTDKFLFIIPEYNGSYPGVLKAFIDACVFPESFYNKKACLTGISSGRYGNIRGVEHFNGVCAYLHLNVMPLRIHISQIKQELNENGDFYKEDTLKFVNEQMDKFVSY